MCAWCSWEKSLSFLSADPKVDSASKIMNKMQNKSRQTRNHWKSTVKIQPPPFWGGGIQNNLPSSPWQSLPFLTTYNPRSRLMSYLILHYLLSSFFVFGISILYARVILSPFSDPANSRHSLRITFSMTTAHTRYTPEQPRLITPFWTMYLAPF